MTTRDQTPMILEQRCSAGHLHVYVVSRHVVRRLLEYYPHCAVGEIDKELLPEANALVEVGL